MAELNAVRDVKTSRASPWYVLAWVAAVIPAGLFLPRWIGLGWAWAVVAALMLAALGSIGISLGKGSTGILIDPTTNTMSLSRFQVVLWTWIILSAFVSLALARIWDSRAHPWAYGSIAQVAGEQTTGAGPLDIQLPELLWGLMGISLTSAVGAPLLKASKALKTADQDQANAERAQKRGQRADTAPTYRAVLEGRIENDANLGAGVGEVQPVGALVRKASWRKAVLSDLLTGEEVATFGYVDVARVQNFLFTIVAAVCYAAALAGTLSAHPVAQVAAFPDPTAGLVALIGISHAGYLADHAVVHSNPIAQQEEI